MADGLTRRKSFGDLGPPNDTTRRESVGDLVLHADTRQEQFERRVQIVEAIARVAHRHIIDHVEMGVRMDIVTEKRRRLKEAERFGEADRLQKHILFGLVGALVLSILFSAYHFLPSLLLDEDPVCFADFPAADKARLEDCYVPCPPSTTCHGGDITGCDLYRKISSNKKDCILTPSAKVALKHVKQKLKEATIDYACSVDGAVPVSFVQLSNTPSARPIFNATVLFPTASHISELLESGNLEEGGPFFLVSEDQQLIGLHSNVAVEFSCNTPGSSWISNGGFVLFSAFVFMILYVMTTNFFAQQLPFRQQMVVRAAMIIGVGYMFAAVQLHYTGWPHVFLFLAVYVFMTLSE